MLKQSAEFPHPGSTIFVAPHGEEVRIIQNNADGSHLVARHRHPSSRLRSEAQQSIAGACSASDTFRAEPDALFATQEAAIGRKPKRRRAA